jgi:NhaP-type Na+/H+ and K+/H+ antiporter
MTLTAHKVANVLSIVELIALFVGGSIVASFAIGSSLILLLGVTLGWLVLLLIEQAALRHGTRNLLIVCGAFRLVGMTAICMAPIVLAPYHSQDSGT